MEGRGNTGGAGLPAGQADCSPRPEEDGGQEDRRKAGQTLTQARRTRLGAEGRSRVWGGVGGKVEGQPWLGGGRAGTGRNCAAGARALLDPYASGSYS